MPIKEQRRILEERKFQDFDPRRKWPPGAGPGGLYPLVPYDSASGGKAIE